LLYLQRGDLWCFDSIGTAAPWKILIPSDKEVMAIEAIWIFWLH